MLRKTQSDVLRHVGDELIAILRHVTVEFSIPLLELSSELEVHNVHDE